MAAKGRSRLDSFFDALNTHTHALQALLLDASLTALSYIFLAFVSIRLSASSQRAEFALRLACSVPGAALQAAAHGPGSRNAFITLCREIEELPEVVYDVSPKPVHRHAILVLFIVLKAVGGWCVLTRASQSRRRTWAEHEQQEEESCRGAFDWLLLSVAAHLTAAYAFLVPPMSLLPSSTTKGEPSLGGFSYKVASTVIFVGAAVLVGLVCWSWMAVPAGDEDRGVRLAGDEEDERLAAPRTAGGFVLELGVDSMEGLQPTYVEEKLEAL